MTTPVVPPQHPDLPPLATPGQRIVAEGMEDLTLQLRAWLGLENQEPTRMPLGGATFDVVITTAGHESRNIVNAMDQVQVNGCGPVIENPARDGWMDSGLVYWLVPPGSAQRRALHPHAICLGAPHSLTLPALSRVAPPGPYCSAPARATASYPFTRCGTSWRGTGLPRCRRP